MERTCKCLLNLSRSTKPCLLQLTLHFTTTWNLDHIVEVTAQFSVDHVFHAVFMCKNKAPNWITGGWSTERKKKLSSGSFEPEKLRLGVNFVEKTSRYIEYWLKNFQFDALKIRVENLIPGKESEIQQMNYIGSIPPLRVKKFILQGANNIRFILNFLNALVPNQVIISPTTGKKKKIIDIEMVDVGKLDQIFHCNLMSKGSVNFKFHRVSTHFSQKTLTYINGPTMDFVARKIPAETINCFLRRWSREELIDDFRLLTITETTEWKDQKMSMSDILKGVRYQQVALDTHVELNILKCDKNCKIFQILGYRMAFCVLSGSQFIFEVPDLSDCEQIEIIPQNPVVNDDFDRQRSRLYLELFRGRLVRFFNS
uniref:F-box associated domain-containing protein n=1 Tax=Caenorhabditis japonica TaxID=281687 RepID=A0A8R1DEF9_CAEJA